MKRRLRRIATAGNAAALVLAVAVLANGEVLFGPASARESSPQPLSQGRRAQQSPDLFSSPSPPGSGSRRVRTRKFSAPLSRDEAGVRSPRVLLVVIDALRVDAAQDGRLMPNLHRVAGGGASGVATVESWIPSTVAGIRALIEGAVPPPASFLQDFGTGRAPSGGIFEALSSAGLRSFAAGPRLWSDLYGPWLAGSVSVDSMAGDDGWVLAAGLDALERGGYDLIVVHLGKPDAAAHLHGACSPEYREAVRRADAALGELMDRAGPGTTVIVTSDHGVTDQGGHAGSEQEVLEVPVALGGPDLLPSGFGKFPQKDLPRLVLSPFGLSLPAAPPEAPRRFRATAYLLFLLALVAGMVICRALMAGAEGGRVATLLPAALWFGIVLAVLGLFRLALLIVLAALGFAAWKAAGPWRSRRRLSGFGRTEPEWIGALAALGFAWLLGSSRLFEPRFDDLSFARGFRPLAILFVASGLLRHVRLRKGLEAWRAHPKMRTLAAAFLVGVGAWILGGPPLLGLCALAGLAGAVLGSFLFAEVRLRDGPVSLLAWALDRFALQLGFLCGFLPAFFSSLQGETASLSTLDVRFAFRIADGPLGLPGAVLAVLLSQGLPTLALLLGLAPALGRSHPGQTGEFAAGMALAVLGQGLAVGLSLTGFPFLGGRGSEAVGLLVRLVGEVTFLFLGSAAAVAFGRIRPPAARPRPLGATFP